MSKEETEEIPIYSSNVVITAITNSKVLIVKKKKTDPWHIIKQT